MHNESWNDRLSVLLKEMKHQERRTRKQENKKKYEPAKEVLPSEKFARQRKVTVLKGGATNRPNLETE